MTIWDGYHESGREVAERRAAMPASNPSDTTHTVEVKVPVTTVSEGQYGRPERYTGKYVVSFDGAVVTLTNGSTSHAFPWAGIEAAIAVLGSLA